MTKTCPECQAMIKIWNEKCRACGFTLALEPDEAARARYLRGPSLGALLWTQGWAVGARTYLWFIASLIPIVGVAALIVLTIFGRRISWERGGWASWAEFQSRMRLLDRIGIVWIGVLILVYVLARRLL